MTFETDAEGKIKLNPIEGWEIGNVAGIALALKLDYVSGLNERNREKVARESIQFMLTAEEALELAEVLKRRGTALLSQKAGAESKQ